MKPEDKAVVQQLCDALKKASITVDSFSVQRQVNEALDAGKALLEQPEPVQEPDAVVTGYHGGQCVITPTDPARVFSTGTAFYTQPADHSEQHLDMVDHGDELTIAYLDGVHTGKQMKREWVGLTAKDLSEIPANCYEGAIWADAKLKEKNT
jgi:hypothetical protein